MSYVLGRTVVDVGDAWDGFNEIKRVLLTHAHFDHIYGLNDLLKVSPETIVYTNEVGREMLLDPKKNLSFFHGTPFKFEYPDRIMVVKDGDEILLDDGLTAKALFTPGHNPSCITWEIGDSLFTGDSYIPGLKTVTNLPGGNKHQAKESLSLILELAKTKKVFPGHYADVAFKDAGLQD